MGKIDIFCDVDDVLFYSSKLLVELHGEATRNYKDWNKLNTWNFKNLFPDITNDIIEEYFSKNTFYLMAEPVRDGLETLSKAMKGDFYAVNIISKGKPNNLDNKFCHLMDVLGNNLYLYGIKPDENKNKVDMCGGIQIDDNIENLRSCNSAVKILYKIHEDTDYNKVDSGENIYVVRSWKEISDMLNFYEKEGKIV